MLTSKTLNRLSGLALVSGGASGMLAHLIHPASPENGAGVAEYAATGVLPHLLLSFAVLLVLLGMPAMYVRLNQKAGVAALIGYICFFIGVPVADMFHAIVEFAILPTGAQIDPVATWEIVSATYSNSLFGVTQIASIPVMFVGSVLMALTTWRSGEFPRWIAGLLILFLVAQIVMLLPLPESIRHLAGHFPVLFYLSMASYGLMLAILDSDRGEATLPATFAQAAD